MKSGVNHIALLAILLLMFGAIELVTGIIISFVQGINWRNGEVMVYGAAFVMTGYSVMLYDKRKSTDDGAVQEDVDSNA